VRVYDRFAILSVYKKNVDEIYLIIFVEVIVMGHGATGNLAIC